MDFQMPFIFVSIFSLASLVLVFIFKFGIKEKSYEEALAEQRQQSSILLGVKPKLKEKKNKKIGKKGLPATSKEKPEEIVQISNEIENSEIVEEKHHVEFKEVAEEVPNKIEKPITTKKTKKEKIRPILVHKEQTESDLEDVNLNTNGSDNLVHPKSDVEIIESTGSQVQEKSENIKIEPIVQKNVVKKAEATLVQKETAPQVIVNGFTANSGKEKKKKKSESNTLQQLAGENGLNMSALRDLVRKAELSRSEIQILIDLLLNKQHEAPAVLDEWSEGKSDPVQKLKKQLAEKEKLLLEEQEAVVSAQNKLREIRTEYQIEKSSLHQKLKGLEEIFQSTKIEASRNHQQVQQLQAQIKDEIMKNRNLVEEATALQMQRQQFEIRLGQVQETEILVSQLQSQVQELSSMTTQQRMENIAEKERNQSFIAQLSNFQKELEQKNDRNRKLEEACVKLERDLDAFRKQDTDIKLETTHLNTIIQKQNEEIRRLEHSTKQCIDELQTYKEESNKKINELTSDLLKAQEENVQIKSTQLNGRTAQENKEHQVEILNLHNELSSIKAKFSQTEKGHETELKVAKSLVEKLQNDIKVLNKQLNDEKLLLEEQKTKNNELREKNWKVMEALNASELKFKNIAQNNITKSEDEIQREFIQRLFPEISDPEIVNPSRYKNEGEKFIKKHIENLRNQSSGNNSDELQQYKQQFQHYKTALDNAEKVLNNLQNHIEQEERTWRIQLSEKSAELNSVKETNRQLQEKLVGFEK